MTVVAFEQCELDLDKVQLRVDGRPRPVEPQVFAVLAFLVQHRDRVVTKEQLLDEVWHSRFVTESALSSRIKSARRAIGDDGQAQRLIRTVHGRGFQFVGQARAVEPATVAQRSTPVPRPLTPTIGRQRDIEGVLRLLDRGQIVTLLGPGGVGKTRLAIEAALRHSEVTSMEGCFVDLTKVRDAELVPELIARQLGIRVETLDNAQQALEEALGERAALLVLDNFEHVIEAAVVVADAVRRSPSVRVLATSRARLRVAGEQIHDVTPLSNESGDDSTPDAVALFAQAATALDPSFELEPNLGDVVAMCRAVEGLPLAIELAAGHVRTLPPALLRTRLGARLGSPTSAARDAPPRQQTIPATIDWSLQLLGDPERRLFARLGVFEGPVPLEGIEQVCADPGVDVVEVLVRLVDQSLVRRVTDAQGGPRFGLLELLRERARELLTSSAEADAIAGRHAMWVAAHVEYLEERRWTEVASSSVGLVNEVLGEVRAAHAWADQHGEAELATRMTASLGDFWHREARHADAGRWVADALAQCDQLDAGLVGRLHITAGFVEWFRDKLVAREHWTAAADTFRALGQASFSGTAPWASPALEREPGRGPIPWERYLAASLALASVTYVGDPPSYDLAIRLCDEAVELAHRVRESPLLALTLNLKGELARGHGDDEIAFAAYEEASQFASRAGDDEDLGVILGNLCFLAEHRGDYDEARRLGREALRLCRSSGRRMAIAAAVSQLAGPELGLGRPDRGARLLGAADETIRVLGVTYHEADRSEHDRLVAGLRDALGEDAFRRLSAEGARLSLDQAVELALT